MCSVVVFIITEKTSHIDILWLVFLDFLLWSSSSSSTGTASSWSTSHSGHLGKTSCNHFVEWLSTECFDHFIDLFFL